MTEVYRVTRYCNDEHEDTGNASPAEPMWVIDGKYTVLCPLYPEHEGTSYLWVSSMYDEFKVVDNPDEWPDEVCTAIALRALIGGDE